MLFDKSSIKPTLGVWYGPGDNFSTFMKDRLDAVVESVSPKYHVVRSERQQYLGHNFDQCAVFEHDGGMFKVVDWGDRDHPEKMQSACFLNMDKCQYILKCQYNPLRRVKGLRPCLYAEKGESRWLSDNAERLREKTKGGGRLYWRGNHHMGRAAVLHALKDVLNPSYREYTSVENYFEELSSHRLALSLPGFGAMCHREFECYAVGTVAVSPEIKNVCCFPVEPDVHYACVRPRPGETMDRAIRRRVEAVTHDEWVRIRENAMTYYDQYVRIDSSVKWWAHLLEL